MADDAVPAAAQVVRGSSVGEQSGLGNVPLAVFLAESDKVQAAHVRELRSQIEALGSLIETRLNAMDKAMTIFQDSLTRVPTDVDKQVGHLRELMVEKFDSITLQFVERDVRVEQTARDTRVAVDAALQAAKEAVAKQNENFTLSIDKSDTATAKQIDSIGDTLRTASSGLERQIGDLKDRLTRIESAGVGRAESMIEHRAVAGDNRASMGQVIAIVGAGITVLLFVLAVASFIITNMNGA